MVHKNLQRGLYVNPLIPPSPVGIFWEFKLTKRGPPPHPLFLISHRCYTPPKPLRSTILIHIPFNLLPYIHRLGADDAAELTNPLSCSCREMSKGRRKNVLVLLLLRSLREWDIKTYREVCIFPLSTPPPPPLVSFDSERQHKEDPLPIPYSISLIYALRLCVCSPNCQKTNPIQTRGRTDKTRKFKNAEINFFWNHLI